MYYVAYYYPVNAITRYRNRKNLTQQGLAELFGITQPMVAHLENGVRKPSPRLALHIEAVTKGEIRRHVLRPDVYPVGDKHIAA